jgi:hypothetical protein
MVQGTNASGIGAFGTPLFLVSDTTPMVSKFVSRGTSEPWSSTLNLILRPIGSAFPKNFRARV